jgi:hypothetical protein
MGLSQAGGETRAPFHMNGASNETIRARGTEAVFGFLVGGEEQMTNLAISARPVRMPVRLEVPPVAVLRPMIQDGDRDRPEDAPPAPWERLATQRRPRRMRAPLTPQQAAGPHPIDQECRSGRSP